MEGSSNLRALGTEVYQLRIFPLPLRRSQTVREQAVVSGYPSLNLPRLSTAVRPVFMSGSILQVIDTQQPLIQTVTKYIPSMESLRPQGSLIALRLRMPVAQTQQNSLTDTATTIAIAIIHKADTTTTAFIEIMTEIIPLTAVIHAVFALNIFFPKVLYQAFPGPPVCSCSVRLWIVVCQILYPPLIQRMILLRTFVRHTYIYTQRWRPTNYRKIINIQRKQDSKTIDNRRPMENAPTPHSAKAKRD